MHPIEIEGRQKKLNKSQLNYSMTEKEALAIVHTLIELRHITRTKNNYLY